MPAAKIKNGRARDNSPEIDAINVAITMATWVALLTGGENERAFYVQKFARGAFIPHYYSPFILSEFDLSSAVSVSAESSSRRLINNF